MRSVASTMPFSILDDVERDCLGLALAPRRLRGRWAAASDGGGSQRLHAEVLDAAERALARVLEGVRGADAPKHTGLGALPFVPTGAATSASSPPSGASRRLGILAPSSASAISPSGSPASSGSPVAPAARDLRVSAAALADAAALAHHHLYLMLRADNPHTDPALSPQGYVGGSGGALGGLRRSGGKGHGGFREDDDSAAAAIALALGGAGLVSGGYGVGTGAVDRSAMRR